MAINTSRAERKTDEYFKLSSAAGENVAPGSYANTFNEPMAVPGESAVPFSSLQEKVLNPNNAMSNLSPGPGAYDQETPMDEIMRLTQSFASKSARMAPSAPGSTVYTAGTMEKNPGPGQYSARSEWTPRINRALRPPVKPVLEVLDKTVPSIPIQRLKPGQKPVHSSETDADMGNTMMKHTGEREDTVGPAEYSPRGDAIVAKSLPSTNFHASKNKRDLWNAVATREGVPSKDGPGPGAYEVSSSLASKRLEDEEDVEILNTFQFTSKTPLAHQIEVKEDLIVPGPGQYTNNPLNMEKGAAEALARSEALGDRIQFGSSTERIGWSRPLDQPYVDPYHVHHVPGPGYYPPPKTFKGLPYGKELAEKALPGAHKKKIHGVHHPTIIIALQETQGPLQAFNSTDDRPCNKTLPQNTPAPSAYNLDDSRGASISSDLKERSKVGRRGVFGTCADRFYGSPLAGREGLPDPGAGMDDSGDKKSGANSEPRSAFQSQTDRFKGAAGPKEVHAVKLGNEDTPAPGTYTTTKEVNYRSPFRHPRVEHVSFGSGQTRYRGTKDIFDGHRPDLTNPCPGDYDAKIDKSKRAPAPVKAKRNIAPPVGCTTEEVGPGSYSVLTSTLLKRTFNVTTQAPAAMPSSARAKEQQGPAPMQMQAMQA